MTSRRRIVALVVLAAATCPWLLASVSARAQDPYADLSASQSALAEAETRLQAAEAQTEKARRALMPIETRADAATEEAEAATERARRIEQDLIASREGAARSVEKAESAYDEQLDEHTRTEGLTVGIGIGLMLLALLVLSWDRLRQLRVFEWLSKQDTGLALAVCAGVAFLGFIAAASLVGSSSLLGCLALVIGLALAAVAWAARHSLRVARGEATPLYLTDRLRARGLRTTAAFFAAVAMFFFVVSLASGKPEFEQPTAETVRLAEEAAGNPSAPPTPELTAALTRARPLIARARALRGDLSQARSVLTEASREVAAARSSVSDSKQDIRAATALINQQEAQAERQAAREAAAAERAAERAAEDAAQPADGGGGCTPGYSPCLPPASDYDCDGNSGDGPEYTGVVSVTGSDPYDLDADGDGTGCD